jgi:CBS domain-containing protein
MVRAVRQMAAAAHIRAAGIRHAKHSIFRQPNRGEPMNLDNLSARDLYVPIEKYPHITEDAPVSDAMALMHRALVECTQYRTILVTDRDRHLRGYLSLRDLIRAVGPDFLRKKEPSYRGNQPFQFIPQDFTALSLIWQEGFTLKVKEAIKKPVNQVMTLVGETVSFADPFAKCLYLMLARDLAIVPVIEGEQVVGAVRLVDLFERIAQATLES